MNNETKSLAEAKLELSGLTLADAKQLGITLHDNLQALHKQFSPVPGLRFQYRDPSGSPLEVRPGWGEFYRVRRLREPEKTGFDQQTDPTAKTKGKGNRPKYDQPAGSGIAAYFPSNFDWLEGLLDPEVSVLITEGELKAAKACREGVPCIGIGGVNSYRSADLGFVFLPSLEAVEWRRRKVYIVFDSDVKVNSSVASAVNDLGEQLYLRGATPYCVFLPDVEGLEKTGLDDYIVAKGIDSLRQLCAGSNDDLMLTKAAWEWNRRYVHIMKPHCILEQVTGDTMKVEEYQKANQETNYVVRTLSNDGEPILTQTSLASAVLKWPHHYKLERLVYDPTLPSLQAVEGESAFNTWQGWGCEPKKGDIGPYQELFDHLFGDATQEAKWLKTWFAYQLQHPGVKLKTAVLLIGAHGSGKSMLAEILAGIFGNNYREVDANDFFGQFNEWAARSQFVLANEVIVKGDTDIRVHSSALKNYITRKTVNINEKYGLKYSIEDRCNIYMTANPMDSLPIDNGERRYFVFRTKAGRIADVKGFLKRWDDWKARGGVEALFYHLLHEVDTRWFDPMAPAMETEAFRQVVDHQVSDTDEVARDLLANGPKIGSIRLTSDLFTMQHLYSTLSEDIKRYIRTPAMLKKALLNNGAVRLNGRADSLGRLKHNGSLATYYAIRNQASWEKASAEEMRLHLKQHDIAFSEPEKKY